MMARTLSRELPDAAITPEAFSGSFDSAPVNIHLGDISMRSAQDDNGLAES